MGWILSFAVAAVVAGQTVGDEQVAHWAAAQGGERQAFQYLVQAAWTEQEAAERGVQVADATAKDAAEAPHDGLSRADMVYSARITLLEAGIKEQIATPAARSVSPAQVDAYVDANPRLLPERRRVRIVRARTRTQAARTKQAIDRGLTWSAAGKRLHQGTGSPRTVERGHYDEKIEDALFKAKLNKTTRYRTFVFKVTQVLPQRPMPRAQQEAMAWEQLSSEAQQTAIAQFTVGYTAKWRARTSCAPAYQAEPVCAEPPGA